MDQPRCYPQRWWNQLRPGCVRGVLSATAHLLIILVSSKLRLQQGNPVIDSGWKVTQPPAERPTTAEGEKDMATSSLPQSTSRNSGVSEVHIIWLTAGLSCDGDSVSVTAAEQPSIEDLLLGAIPGLPKVHLHNPVLAVEVGDDFMKWFYEAEKGRLNPFVLVVEGSIPNERIKREGYWAAQGTDYNSG